MSEPWTFGQDKILIQNWNRLSASKIGALVKKSRNAVIGRANRLDLASKPKGGQPGEPHPHRGKRTNVINRSRIADWRKAHKPVFPVTASAPASQGVTFMELGPAMCKWPIGNLFCGASTDLVYCPYHTWKAIRRSEGVQRSGTEGRSTGGEASPDRRKATS